MNFKEYMTYDSLKTLREQHPAWRLLAADNSSFILSFLYKEFIMLNTRQLSEHTLISHLEQHMESIPHIKNNSKKAKDYLLEWSDDMYGWLRRFYPKNGDEIYYDLSSSAEKAIEWLISLKPQSFIGTESRLMMVFDLLQQILSGTQTDPKLKLIELEKKKQQLEEEIESVKKGNIKNLEPTQIKERFLQASYMSREILTDFRAVEQNFRELSQNIREKIASWDRSKGELIGTYFSEQNDIYQTDQGRSFDTFFNFIMSSDARTRFDETIKKLKKNEVLENIVRQSGMENIVNDWLQGSTQVWTTVENISEQLRRYVDESYVDEEKRIKQLIKNIETKAIKLKGQLLKQTIQEIDEIKVDINLTMDRTLFSPPRKIKLLDIDINYGTANTSEISLYSHIYVDKQKLIETIKYELTKQPEIGLSEIITKYPLQYGLAELLSYLSLGEKINNRIINGEYEFIEYTNLDFDTTRAKIPKIIYFNKNHSK